MSVSRLRRFAAGVLLLFLLFPAVCVRAEETASFTVVNYNVAGLPKLFGNGAEDVRQNQRTIGVLLAERNFDIIAVQEDFGYHKALMEGLEGYPYSTEHTGAVPGGDGMNVFSRFPLHTETRTPWETAYGVIDHGADEMTPKGILYTLVELEEGVYLDLYTIHADAFGDAGSSAARLAQFRQLAQILGSRTEDRPLIVLGDFNTSLKYENSSGLWEELMEPCGLSDAWIELYNGGDYADFSAHAAAGGRYDSIEKILYRSGNGVSLTPVSFAYEEFTAEDGTALSDHPAAAVGFTYEKTAAFTETAAPPAAPKVTFWSVIGDLFSGVAHKVKYIAVDLGKLVTHFDELWAYITD